jgi:hypothetical protein
MNKELTPEQEIYLQAIIDNAHHLTEAEVNELQAKYVSQ